MRDDGARLGPRYARLWTAAAVSNLGDGVTLAAAPLLAASLTHDARLIAGVTAAAAAPWLFAPVSGTLADRLDRRQIMAIVEAARGVALALLGIAVLMETARLPLLYAVVFVGGLGETLYDTAAGALVPALVPEDQLPRANSRLLAVETTCNELMGPPLGAALFGVVAALPFFLDAGSFAIAAMLLLTLRGRYRAKRSAEVEASSFKRDLGDGFRFLFRHPYLRSLTLVSMIANLVSAANLGVAVIYAHERLGLSSFGFGLFLGSGAVGGAIGALLAPRVVARVGEGRTLIVATVFEGFTDAVLAWTRAPVIAGVALAFGMIAANSWVVVATSLRQTLVPDAVRGRTLAVTRMVSFGALPIGALLGGVLVAATGLPQATFAVSAGVLIVGGMLVVPLLGSNALARARAMLATERG